MAGIIEVKDQGKVRIYDADNSNYVDIVVPSTVSSNRTITIPDATFTIPTSNTPDDDAITAAKLNNDIISGTTELASEPADTDEFLVSDAGTLKRIDYSLIKGGGITMVDQWRLSQDLGFSSGENAITSYWEQADTDGVAIVGSSMTQSSGVFTFPTTGIYLITAQTVATNNGDRLYQGHQIAVTLDNSSYSSASTFLGSSENGGAGGYYVSSFSDFILDVTNTSNVKVKLIYSSNGSGSIKGSTSETKTGINFIRLGDT